MKDKLTPKEKEKLIEIFENEVEIFCKRYNLQYEKREHKKHIFAGFIIRWTKLSFDFQLSLFVRPDYYNGEINKAMVQANALLLLHDTKRQIDKTNNLMERIYGNEKT